MRGRGRGRDSVPQSYASALSQKVTPRLDSPYDSLTFMVIGGNQPCDVKGNGCDKNAAFAAAATAAANAAAEATAVDEDDDDNNDDDY
ncbi:hypothetical protein PoB_005931400 [Plakobranchus ocellatus]|uniref:Uncharacterized protein n=1 Tax=Plakobranchus ocellatus TaxID=259542 RepID=A0AAV4CJ29_9GAST|nr:hypothetical protein PoB_005931400 [Plakobranchus ocellatus]